MMRRFLKGWLGRQAAVLRGLLRLKTEGDVPQDLTDLITAVAREYSVATESFGDLLSLHGGAKKDPVEVAHALETALAALAEIVDTMDA